MRKILIALMAIIMVLGITIPAAMAQETEAPVPFSELKTLMVDLGATLDTGFLVRERKPAVALGLQVLNFKEGMAHIVLHYVPPQNNIEDKWGLGLNANVARVAEQANWKWELGGFNPYFGAAILYDLDYTDEAELLGAERFDVFLYVKAIRMF